MNDQEVINLCESIESDLGRVYSALGGGTIRMHSIVYVSYILGQIVERVRAVQRRAKPAD